MRRFRRDKFIVSIDVNQEANQAKRHHFASRFFFPFSC
jgi:hypothetical protein